MTQNPQALGHIPALVNVVSAGPHLLLNLRRLLDGAKDLQRSQALDHVAELVLLVCRRKASGNAEGESHASQVPARRQGGELGRDALGVVLDVRVLRLPPEDDSVEVGQHSVHPDLVMDGHGRVHGVVVGRGRRLADPGEGILHDPRKGLLDPVLAGNYGVHGLDAALQGVGEDLAPGPELGRGERAGLQLLLLPSVEAGDVANHVDEPVVQAKELVHEDGAGRHGVLAALGRVAPGDDALLVGPQTGRPLERHAGHDVHEQHVGGEEPQGGLVGAPRPLDAQRRRRPLGCVESVQDLRPVLGLRQDLAEEGDGGVEVNLPVAAVTGGHLKGRHLGDGLQQAQLLVWIRVAVARVHVLHLLLELAQAVLELALKLVGQAIRALLVVHVAVGEEDAKEVGAHGDGRVVDSSVLLNNVEHPAASSTENGRPVVGEQIGEDVVEEDHDKVNVNVGPAVLVGHLSMEDGAGPRYLRGRAAGGVAGGRRQAIVSCAAVGARARVCIGIASVSHALVLSLSRVPAAEGVAAGSRLEFCGEAVGYAIGETSVAIVTVTVTVTMAVAAAVLLTVLLALVHGHVTGARLEQLHVFPVAALAGLLLDLGLDPVGHVLLPRPAVHPIRLVVAKVAGNFEGVAGLALGAGLVALFAPQPACPAAGVGSHPRGHEAAEHRHGEVR